MPFVFKGTNITAINYVKKDGTKTVLSKLNFAKKGASAVTVWESWVAKTGRFTSSNSTYSASGFHQAVNGSNKYTSNINSYASYAFDDNGNTYLHCGNPQETGSPTSTWYFGRKLKIKTYEIKIGIGGPAWEQNTEGIYLEGIKEDGSTVNLGKGVGYWYGMDYDDVKYVAHTSADQNTPFIGIKFYRAGTGQGWYRYYDFKITSWEQQGA